MGGRRGFTLLEAVLALAILSGATMAMLGIRAQSMIASEKMGEIQRAERDAQAVFDLMVAGMLGKPESVDTAAGETRWRGVLGIETEREYTVRRLPEVRENPARERFGDSVPREVALWRYEIAVGGKEMVFLWHR